MQACFVDTNRYTLTWLEGRARRLEVQLLAKSPQDPRSSLSASSSRTPSYLTKAKHGVLARQTCRCSPAPSPQPAFVMRRADGLMTSEEKMEHTRIMFLLSYRLPAELEQNGAGGRMRPHSDTNPVVAADPNIATQGQEWSDSDRNLWRAWGLVRVIHHAYDASVKGKHSFTPCSTPIRTQLSQSMACRKNSDKP